MLTAVFYILLTFAWANAALWLAGFFWTRREISELEFVRPEKFLPPENQPRVSILLPARDEEKRILRRNVDSLLAQDYANFEIVAVNDRSTDHTGKILREIARENKNLNIIEGKEPPDGWLGKPFALQQALERADGEWILTTDADLVFAPEAVKIAVLYAVENDFDALCLLPFVRCETFWERVFMPVFEWFRMLKMPPTRVNNFNRAETMGVGNFFLVRRASLRRIADFAAVRGEVAEDLKLAELLKQTGARFNLKAADDLLETRMYAGFGEIWRGFTKNFFAGQQFAFARTILETVSLIVQGALPFAFAVFCLAAWLVTGQNWFLAFFAPLALTYFLQLATFAPLYRRGRISVFYSLFAPLGVALFAAILVNSMFKVLSGKGVTWKGRVIYKSEKKSPLET